MANQKNAEKLRFVLVGGANTAIDFGVLFLLRSIGMPIIGANIISTTVAFLFSFFANKKFTFQTTNTNVRREFILFVIVTLFGLWVLQSVVISVVNYTLSASVIDDSIRLLLAKLIATVVSLTWNYLLYSRVVFNKS